MDRGNLIILNGGSSAGKTSLGLALQDTMLPETWLLLGIDAFWFSLSPQALDLERVTPEYYSWDVHLEDGLEYERPRSARPSTREPGPSFDRANGRRAGSVVREIATILPLPPENRAPERHRVTR